MAAMVKVFSSLGRMLDSKSSFDSNPVKNMQSDEQCTKCEGKRKQLCCHG